MTGLRPLTELGHFDSAMRGSAARNELLEARSRCFSLVHADCAPNFARSWSELDPAISANFGNLADDAEVALDVVAVLFPPSAPFDVAAGVLLELAAYWAPSIHITPDPNPMVDAQTTLTRAGRA